MGVMMTQVTMALKDTLAMIAELQKKGYTVLSFGNDGWACELNGDQIFRATASGDRFIIKYNPERLAHAKT